MCSRENQGAQYAPGIDLSVIENVKKAVSIPVIGNGDIYSADDAIKMMQLTGCDGVMVGRGAQGNPWIFSEIGARLEGREFIIPTLEERFATALKQLSDMIREKGERVGIAEAKKHMAWYIDSVRGAAQARAKIMTSSCYADVERVFDEIIRSGREE